MYKFWGDWKGSKTTNAEHKQALTSISHIPQIPYHQQPNNIYKQSRTWTSNSVFRINRRAASSNSRTRCAWTVANRPRHSPPRHPPCPPPQSTQHHPTTTATTLRNSRRSTSSAKKAAWTAKRAAAEIGNL